MRSDLTERRSRGSEPCARPRRVEDERRGGAREGMPKGHGPDLSALERRYVTAERLDAALDRMITQAAAELRSEARKSRGG